MPFVVILHLYVFDSTYEFRNLRNITCKTSLKAVCTSKQITEMFGKLLMHSTLGYLQLIIKEKNPKSVHNLNAVWESVFIARI